jgi:hypothetical protein
MTLPTRTVEPTHIITGETLEWTRSYDDYPASLWHLNYYFRGPGVGFNAAWGTEVTADGDDFVITVPTTKTDDMTVAGRYKWEAWVTEIADSSNKQLVGSGFASVSLALTQGSTAAADQRTTAQKIVDAIDAALLANESSTSDIIEYEISTPAGTRRVKRSRVDAMALRDKYAIIAANERAREDAARTGRFGTRVAVRYSDL